MLSCNFFRISQCEFIGTVSKWDLKILSPSQFERTDSQLYLHLKFHCIKFKQLANHYNYFEYAPLHSYPAGLKESKI
jgi:hypothetical protein